MRFETIPKFKYFLDNIISIEFGIHLSGSWLSNEQHIHLRGDKLVSFSDIDYVTTSSFSLQDSNRLNDSIYLKFSLYEFILLGGISVRNKSDMDSLWVFPINNKKDKVYNKEDFSIFWISIACIETMLVLKPYDDEYFKTYHINKYFLRIWRIIAIVSKYEVPSWRHTIEYARPWLSNDCTNLILDLKTGKSPEVKVNKIIKLHLFSIIKCIKANYNVDQKQSYIITLIKDFLSSYHFFIDSKFNELLEVAYLFKCDNAIYERVLQRIEEKYRCQNNPHLFL